MIFYNIYIAFFIISEYHHCLYAMVIKIMILSSHIKQNFYWQYSCFYFHGTSKTIKICPNHHADLLRFLFIEGFFKIKKGLEPVSMPYFWWKFFIKIFLVVYYYINWLNSITRMCLLFKLFSKMCFVFHAWAFDEVMKFEYLKS